MQSSESIAQLKRFKTKAAELVQREKAFAAARSSKQQPNGISLTRSNTGQQDAKSLTIGEHKKVLTIPANVATNTKQLFSSLPKSQSLLERGLPNAIQTTQIIPSKSSGAYDEKKKPPPTLGELFPAPASLQPLQPPKPSKIATTRGSSVGWYHPSSVDPVKSRSSAYSNQNISTGQWLDYNSKVVENHDPQRKRRERALSLSGTRITQPESETAEQEAARMEAMFRSAYSSFAPSKDDSAAIAPTAVMDRIWWQRVGERSFARADDNVGTLDVTMTDADAEQLEILDEAEIEAAINEWDESMVDPELGMASHESKPIHDKDTQEVLDGISELLETLNSYQRNRNLSINPPRSAGTLAAGDVPANAAQSGPSESEIATYNILKSQLALMVSQLPPYAVAKLNSDKLEALSISTKMPILLEDHKSVVEEDEMAAKAKLAAMNASSSRASTSYRNSTSASYGNQFAPTARSTSGAHSYYSTQTPIRATTSSSQRIPSTAPTIPYGQRPNPNVTYQSSQPRFQPTYPHQTPRPSQTGYGQSSSGAQYFQNPTTPSYTPAQSHNYQTASPTVSHQNGQYQNPRLPGYPQRATSVSNGSYGYGNGNGSNAARHVSPQKPVGYSGSYPVSQTQPQTRTYQGPPVAPVAYDHRRYSQSYASSVAPMGNGVLSPAPAAQASMGTGAPSSSTVSHFGSSQYQTVMSSEQQQMVVERQRQQLAQHQSALQPAMQQQARSAAQAGSMGGVGTSYAPQQMVNGGSGSGN